MAVELYPGEVELKRVKEKDIGWTTEQVIADRGEGPEIIDLPHRVHPVEKGQRWVLDRGDDLYDENFADQEWVLLGPKKKPAKTGGSAS
jgi:hypothetical protein